MNMQTDIPDVTAIIPLIAQVKPFAEKIYANDYIEPLEIIDFVKKTQAIHLARLDDKDKPLIKTDARGNKSMLLMWGHPKNYLDVNFLVGMICPLGKDSSGLPGYRPSALVRGPLANIMIVGGMSCCGSALQTHWSEISASGSVKDSSRVPLVGLKSAEHAHWLRGKVDVADNEPKMKSLHAMAMDIMAHRLPNDPRFQRKLEASNDYLLQFARPSPSL
jgi:hypothetical protein